MEKFEKQINAFLSEHKDTIIVKDIKYLVAAAEGCGCGRRASQETLDNGIVDKEWDEEKQRFVDTEDCGMTLREFLTKKAEMGKN